MKKFLLKICFGSPGPHLGQEATAAAAGIEPAFEEQGPELMPGQPPAGQGGAALAVPAQGVRLLGVWRRMTAPGEKAGWRMETKVRWSDRIQ